MIIAVTYDNNNIFQHFGHTEYFKLYAVEDGKIEDTTVVATDGQGHGALADFLAARNVSALICGGIGYGAVAALARAGIAVFGGISGDCDGAVEKLLNRELQYNSEPTCNHHAEGHSCGDHHSGDEASGGCGHHCQ